MPPGRPPATGDAAGDGHHRDGAMPPTERTPLLPDSSTPSRSSAAPAKARSRREQTPLPKMQVFLVCVMRFTEPISYTVIFPFINHMIADVMPGLPSGEVGYYAGIVESVFAAIQFMTVFAWGRLSDRVGRKPVAIIGIVGVMLSVLSFGLAKSFKAMIVARCIAGLMNGNVAVIKAVLAEITDETNQATAFALLPLCFSIGSTIGPLIGGYLADPVEQFPNIFGNSIFLAEYPYFLPCAVASAFNLAAIIVGTLFLQETLPSRVASKDKAKNAPPSERPDDRGGPSTTSPTPEDAPPPKARDLLTRPIVAILTSLTLHNLINAAYMAVLPLFCYESLRNGGVDLSKRDIGLLLSSNGLLSLVSQPFLFPAIERRLGSLRTYRFTLAFLPLGFIGFPFARLAALAGFKAIMASIFALIVCSRAFSLMGIVCSTLLLNNAAPTRSSLGTLNGIAQSCASFSRMLGPASTTALFAASVDKGWLGGQAVWVALFIVASLTFATSLRVRAVPRAWGTPRPPLPPPRRENGEAAEDA